MKENLADNSRRPFAALLVLHAPTSGAVSYCAALRSEFLARLKRVRI
jgi:hypothetical protein